MNRIMICDPDEKERESLKLVLNDFYDLVLIGDASQCLECLKNSKGVNTLLISIGHSKESGPLIIKEIIAKHPKLRVIAITNHQNTAKAEESIRYGASGYMVKPFKREQMLSTVQSVHGG